MAMSVAVVRLAPGNPVTLVNDVRRMPSVRAFAVIRRAKPASLPPSFSESATATSLAELTAIARIASPTVSPAPGRRPSRDGGWFAAARENLTVSDSCSLFASSASNARNSVIILVSDAGRRTRLAPCAYNTRMADTVRAAAGDGAASTGSAKAGTAIAVPGIAASGTGAARLATPAGDAVDTADDMGRTSVASAASTAGIRR
jgi:hypothetical protein